MRGQQARSTIPMRDSPGLSGIKWDSAGQCRACAERCCDHETPLLTPTLSSPGRRGRWAVAAGAQSRGRRFKIPVLRRFKELRRIGFILQKCFSAAYALLPGILADATAVGPDPSPDCHDASPLSEREADIGDMAATADKRTMVRLQRAWRERKGPHESERNVVGQVAQSFADSKAQLADFGQVQGSNIRSP